MHQVTKFNGERFMIEVGLLVAQKTLVHDDRMAKQGVTVRQTPHVFSDSILICERHNPCNEVGFNDAAAKNIDHKQYCNK